MEQDKPQSSAALTLTVSSLYGPDLDCVGGLFLYSSYPGPESTLNNLHTFTSPEKSCVFALRESENERGDEGKHLSLG